MSCLFGISYEQSSRHDLYVPRFEAELAQFCEKLVSSFSVPRLVMDVDVFLKSSYQSSFHLHKEYQN